jgi:hypothetical protein
VAKYAGKTDFPVITDQVIDIVHDAMDFLESRFCHEQFRHSGANPRQWKQVKIHTHRRAGFSTAALKLLGEYRSSLIVTHNYPAGNRLRMEAIDRGLVPDWCEEDFYNNIKIDDHIVATDRMDERWFATRRPDERYQLIILDGASMIETHRNRNGADGMDRFRDRLFYVCDLLVELE